MKKKYGVIGYPIGHTMSPFIQKELFALQKFDGGYDKYEIAPENLAREFKDTLKDFCGFNVTIPHKVNIIPLLDGLDPVAAEYGAVNTVKIEGGRAIGYNTDAYGFLQGLEFAGTTLSGRVLVYGFGGAARTIITESLKAGCEVFIGTTTELKSNAETIAKELSLKASGKIEILTNEEIKEEFDLLINATPVGMYPKTDASPLSEKQIDLFSAVYDIVYNPTETKLLKIAKEKGKVCGGGLSMLVCQAMKAQTIWYGAEWTREETKEVIKKAEKELAEVFG